MARPTYRVGMRTSLASAALALWSAVAVAQAPAFDSSAAAYAALSARLRAETRAFAAARKAVTESAAYVAARAAGDGAEAARLLEAVRAPDARSICREAFEVGKRFDDDDAVRLLGWAAVQGGDRALTREVVAWVEEHHLESPALTALLERADVIARHLGQQRGPAFLAKVIATSPHDVVKAWSYYWQSVALKRRDPATSEALRKRAASLAEGHWLADKILAPEFRRARLQVGMVAPDIAGEDLDGARFQLSDYRGKVVVLDFWGFW